MRLLSRRICIFSIRHACKEHLLYLEPHTRVNVARYTEQKRQTFTWTPLFLDHETPASTRRVLVPQVQRGEKHGPWHRTVISRASSRGPGPAASPSNPGSEVLVQVLEFWFPATSEHHRAFTGGPSDALGFNRTRSKGFLLKPMRVPELNILDCYGLRL